MSRTALPRPTRRSLAAAGTALALLLTAGCSVGSADDDTASTEESSSESDSGSNSEDADTPEETASDDATEESSDDPTSGEDEPAASDAPSVDLSDAGLVDRHQNGAELTVTGVRVEPTSVVISVDVVNGFTDAIQLNSAGVALVDDTGQAYNFREPTTGAKLEIGAGQQLTGDLVFLGRLAPDAKTLTLKTNVYDPQDTIDVTNRFDSTSVPEFLVEGITLPEQDG